MFWFERQWSTFNGLGPVAKKLSSRAIDAGENSTEVSKLLLWNEKNVNFVSSFDERILKWMIKLTGVSTAKLMSELSCELAQAWHRALRALLPPGALFSFPRLLPVPYPESCKILVLAKLSRSVSCFIISVRASRRLGVAGRWVAGPLRRSNSARAFLNGVGVLGVFPPAQWKCRYYRNTVKTFNHLRSIPSHLFDSS